MLITNWSRLVSPPPSTEQYKLSKSTAFGQSEGNKCRWNQQLNPDKRLCSNSALGILPLRKFPLISVTIPQYRHIFMLTRLNIFPTTESLGHFIKIPYPVQLCSYNRDIRPSFIVLLSVEGCHILMDHSLPTKTSTSYGTLGNNSIVGRYGSENNPLCGKILVDSACFKIPLTF